MTALYDGIWEKPHDPAFIKNASVDDTKEALAKAGLTTDFVSIPLTVVVLKVGDRLIMVDSGSGAGQWQPTAGKLAANMAAAGIDPAKIGTILISHFHPDHIFGLMQKGTNAPTFPNAELVVTATEFKWWTEPGRVEKLPEASKGLGTRINAAFPGWKNFKLIEGEKEVAPGIRLVNAPGHTPGHAAFHVSSGSQQLMISNDTAYVPALLAPHPGVAGRLRPGRPAGGGVAAQAARPRDRREDDDLRRPLPVPRRRLVRQGRQRLRVHSGEGVKPAAGASLRGDVPVAFGAVQTKEIDAMSTLE